MFIGTSSLKDATISHLPNGKFRQAYHLFGNENILLGQNGREDVKADHLLIRL